MTAKKKTRQKTRRTKKTASKTRSATRKPAKTGDSEARASLDAGKGSAEFVILLDDPDPESSESASSDAAKPESADLLLNLSTSSEGTRQTMLLPAVCSSQDVADMRRQLLALRESKLAVTIDARDVEELDTAYLQLLCAFVMDSAKNNVEVRWQCGNGPFSSAVENLGLSEQIQCA